MTLYSVCTCTYLASDKFNYPSFCSLLFWTGKSFHASHPIVVCGEGACFYTASSSGAPSLQGNQNFLPVNLHFFWPQPLRPTDSPVQMFSFAFAAAPPAVTPLCLNPKYVACTCSSACLCLPDGWYMQRAYYAHRPLLS